MTKIALASAFALGCFALLSVAPSRVAEARQPPRVTGSSSGVLKLVACPKDSKEPRCQRASSSNAGTIGSGVKFDSDGYPDIRGGFIEGSKLLVAVEWRDAFGGIVEVDLATGNRTLVSGKRNDETQKGSGDPKLNDVDGLGGIQNVQALGNGKLLALVATSASSRRFLIEVDRASGNRRLVWASELASTVDQKKVEAGAVKAESLCKTDKGPNAIPDQTALAIAPNGAVYLGISNNPLGVGRAIARLSAANGWRCERISSNDGTVPAIGKGFNPSRSQYVSSMVLAGGKLQVVYKGNAALLASVELASGDRRRVSDAVRGDSVGAGPEVGGSGIAVDGNTAFTIGGFGSTSWFLTSVDLTTGNRTELAARTGSLSVVPTDKTPGVWVVPGSKFLLVNYDNAIHVLDPASGASNLLSL